MKVNYHFELSGVKIEDVKIDGVNINGNAEFDLGELVELHKFSGQVMTAIRNELPKVIVEVAQAVRDAQRIHGIEV